MHKEYKPPIGVKPAWLVAWERIGELASAIKRQCESSNGNTKQVEEWANEITWQCFIIEAIHEDDKKETASGPAEHINSYHCSCKSCGKDWWANSPFPGFCPFCHDSL